MKGVLAAAAALLLVLLGCGAENSLGGSVSDLFSLAVSRVTVLRNAEAIQVNYYANNGPDIDLVARVTFATEGLDFRAGQSYPMEGEYIPGQLRTSVTHAGAGEAERRFAPVERGRFELQRGGDIDEDTAGSFNMLFDPDSVEYGAARDLTGNFRSVALDAGFGPIPGIDPPP
ncbi:MAG: hypothetical protein ACKVPX_10510 [Myxococcaceae bacterium]